MTIQPWQALAIVCGFIPAFLWLFFWIAEDRKHPEPKRLLLLTFAVGAIVVPLALSTERELAKRLFEPASIETILNSAPLFGGFILFVFALVEEAFKWLAAYAAVLWSKEVDEPIDFIIYLIVAALGFAAYENVLFLFTPFGQGNFAAGLIMGNLRTVGATLLHVVASSLVGLGLAFAFYKPPGAKRLYAIAGFAAAVALHTIFNLAIMASKQGNAIMAFVGVWAAIVVLLLLFERAKKIHPTV